MRPFVDAKAVVEWNAMAASALASAGAALARPALISLAEGVLAFVKRKWGGGGGYAQARSLSLGDGGFARSFWKRASRARGVLSDYAFFIQVGGGGGLMMS
jgi:uncharacterized protein YyaL (SSP411 family)